MTSPSSVLPVEHATTRADLRLRTLVAFGIVLLGFWPTLLSFPPMWIDKGGQGFVAALFVAYMIRRDGADVLRERDGLGLASVVVAGFSLAWLVAYVLNVQAVHQAIIPMVVLAWVLASAGVPALVRALPIAAVSMLAVPVWGVLIRPLQSMTVMANSVLLKLSGIEAVIEGDHITIPSGVFWVASGCAGLNFFETGLLVSTLYSLLFLREWKARYIALALGLTLALIANWLRVFGLIVVGHVTEMQSPLIEEHGLYGWLIFAAAMIVFFTLTRRVEAYDRRLSGRGSEPAAASRAAASPRSAPPHHSSRMLIGPTAAALVGPVLYLLLGGQSATAAPADAAPGVSPQPEWQYLGRVELPPVVGEDSSEATAPGDSVSMDSTAAAAALRPWSPRYVGADEHRAEIWRRDSVEIQLDRFIYREQGQGKELINSENRLIAQSRKMGGGLLGPFDDRGRRINASAIRPPSGARLVWYWYSVAGQNTHSESEAKLLELVAFAKSSPPPAEMVAVSAPCRTDDCSDAHKAIFSFVFGREMPPSQF